MAHKLLLADDSVTIQRVIELTFADEDVEVTTVGDGQLAIERLEGDPPDIVLADVDMPKRDGYEVAAYVRSRPKLAHIPVVLLTGAFEPVDQARAAAAGSTEVLAKPFEPQMVINRVKELLGKKRQDDAERHEPLAPPPAFGAPSASASQPRIEEPTPAGRPSNGGQPVSLDDYFDQLDAAFSNVQPGAPRAEGAHDDLDWSSLAPGASADKPAFAPAASAAPDKSLFPPSASAEKPVFAPASPSQDRTVFPASGAEKPIVAPSRPQNTAPPPAPAKPALPLSQAVPPPGVTRPVSVNTPDPTIPPSTVVLQPPPSVAHAPSAVVGPAAPKIYPPPTLIPPPPRTTPLNGPPIPERASPAAPPIAPPAPPQPAGQAARPVVEPAAPKPQPGTVAPAAPRPATNPFATLSAAKAEAAARSAAPAVTEEVIEDIVKRVLERLTDKVVRETVSSIVSETAERLVQEEIERIKSSGSGS